MTAIQIADSSSPRLIHHPHRGHDDVPPRTDHRRGPRQAWEEADTELFAAFRMLSEGHPHREALRNRLVERYLWLAGRLASRFRDRGEPVDDLTQVATIGLIKSVDRFDPQFDVQFTTFAIPTILGEIKRHFRDHTWAIRVPRPLQELHQQLNTATAELSQCIGRSPTVIELAAHLGVTDEGIFEATDLIKVEDRESLKPLLEGLPSRERKILLLRFFGNMTQCQIAEELGISQMHVSRLLSGTLQRLRDQLLTKRA